LVLRGKEAELKKATMLRLGGALAGTAALAAIAVGGGPATASTPSKARATVITAEKEGKELFFEGPKTVERGATLKIKNNTDPRKVGPHSFSLVREQDLPTSKNAIKACSKKFKGICGAIAEWHKVDLDTGEIGENPVEAGTQGWDRKGSLKRKGDSWVTEKEGQSFKRDVTAPAGKELWFICAVHAEMQGKIEVEG
jgi:hypothetical protein